MDNMDNDQAADSYALMLKPLSSVKQLNQRTWPKFVVVHALPQVIKAGYKTNEAREKAEAKITDETTEHDPKIKKSQR
jgi:hypothetical protein